jgi:hypothetical protein
MFVSAALADDNPFLATGSLGAARNHHTATLLPTGKVLVAGGSPDQAGTRLATTEVYDPFLGTWSAGGPMNAARQAHTATLLRSGRVLVTGGDSSGRGAEIFDPITGVWSVTGAMNTARNPGFSTILLPNGKVLAAGADATGRAAEILDPATGAWSATGAMTAARFCHAATVLPNGKVLVAGGSLNSGMSPVASAELFNPATGTWSATGPLATARMYHTMTLLPNGKVLAVGGASATDTLASAELYDPATGTWSAADAMATARADATATILPTGSLMIAGGMTMATTFPTATEVYDPATGTWSPGPAATTGRAFHSATLLHNGKMLVTGGYNASGTLASSEFYEPSIGGWSMTADAPDRIVLNSPLRIPPLPSGKILVSNVGTPLMQYDPATGSWSRFTTKGLSTPAITLMPSGKLFMVSSTGTSSDMSSPASFDPATDTLTSLPKTNNSIPYHLRSNLLLNGKLLVTALGSELSTELYDPALTSVNAGVVSAPGQWLKAAPPNTRGLNCTSVGLANGKVLVAGGNTSGWDMAPPAQIYDPASGNWTVSGASSLPGGRNYATGTLLPDGRVLIAGGVMLQTSADPIPPEAQGTYEVFDPTTGQWSVPGRIPTFNGDEVVGLRYHSATLLRNGKVLLAGGFALTATIPTKNRSALLFDGSTGQWSNAGNLSVPHFNHFATRMLNGKVLIAGGGTAGGLTNSTEVYDPAQGSSPLLRPQLTSMTSVAGKLKLAGSGFLGVAGAAGGGTQDSSANFPLVLVERLDNEQQFFLSPDPAAGFSDSQFTASIGTDVMPFGEGFYTATVITNGVCSDALPFSVYNSPQAGFMVEYPAGIAIPKGASQSVTCLGGSCVTTFTVRNTGDLPLISFSIGITGANAGDFTVATPPAATVPPGGSTTFAIQFTPSGSATESATIRISNMPQVGSFATFNASSFFNFNLLATPAYSPGQYAASYTTGFAAGQTQGHADVNNSPNSYGLYALNQIPTIDMGVPLLKKDAASGNFKLTMSLQKSTNPSIFTFTPFSMANGTLTLDPQGNLEFQFSPPAGETSAFFRLQAH